MTTLARGFVKRHGRRGCFAGGQTPIKPDTRRQDQACGFVKRRPAVKLQSSQTPVVKTEAGTTSDKRALEPYTAPRVEYATYRRNKILDSLIHFRQYHQYQCDSPAAMADFLVLQETIIGQENHRQQRRANKRGRRDEALPVSLTSQTKRRALGCITNQQLPSRKRQTTAAKSCVRRHEPHSTEKPWNPSLLSSLNPLNSSFMVTDTIDIDIIEKDDCAVGGEYGRDTFCYLREAEVRFHPKPDYMNKQPDITCSMRAILVDWLVEVAEEFRMDPQTLYLAMSITDRFLSSMLVTRSKLQLVGITSLYIAAKLEEIYLPQLGEFAYITDNTYSKEQIIQMERLILQTLAFNLVAPTSYNFLQHYLKAAETEQQQTLGEDAAQLTGQTVEALAMYLCELAMQDSDRYLKYSPSVIAASAVCLARHTVGQLAWPYILQHYSGYNLMDISSCLLDLHRTFTMAPKRSQKTIRQKYFSQKFMKVSTLKPPKALPC